MSDQITVKFSCPSCGSRIVWDEDASDDDRARCEGCDEEMPKVGDLKARALKEVKAEADKMLRNAVKGFKLR